ncbi:MAG: sulfatase-like hydrolase/transferase, partial [Clostridia bacterium]|nr:sulfatase-like hydrolase/transferase [Clostridia bacterium]
MAVTSMVYFLFMNLRLNPTVDRLWEGHDEYLNSLNPTKAENDAPNVLFILMDDMAYADISAYSMMAEGEATINTPNIDSIADGGIFMEDFYASAPVCTPSRFSALTGRYASRGYIDN